MNKNWNTWIKALRSHEYKQGQTVLLDKWGAMCCLGVGESLRLEDNGCDKAEIRDNLLDTGVPDFVFAMWLGIDVPEHPAHGYGVEEGEWDPIIDISQEQLQEFLNGRTSLGPTEAKHGTGTSRVYNKPMTCVTANDEYALSFPEIADLLEQYGVLDPESEDKGY